MTSMNSTRVRNRFRQLALALCVTICASITAPAQTGSWVPGGYLASPHDCPPFVFVSLPFGANGASGGNLGTDSVDDPNSEVKLGDKGRELWFMDPQLGAPLLLFPRAADVAERPALHLASPVSNGSVHEPSVYHHTATGTWWVFFSFARDVSSLFAPVSKPCDIFAMNITSLMTAPNLPQLAADLQSGSASYTNTLPVSQITLAPVAWDNNTSADAESRAFNADKLPQFHTSASPNSQLNWPYGPNSHPEINIGGVVVDEEHGPVLYYCSNEKRTHGQRMMAGDLSFTGSDVEMLARREIQHFGTTSMLSFFESPRGAAGSYRSSTESPNQWSVFEFYSDEATWQTVSGYGNQQNLADHNGTTLGFGRDPQDSLLAISRYYINQNKSYGTIVMLRYDRVGLNTDTGTNNRTLPSGETVFAVHQVGPYGPESEVNLFPDISLFQDEDSSVGKFAHPAGGRFGATMEDAELFLTYSPLVSHGGLESSYHGELVVVTDVSEQIDPHPTTGNFLPPLGVTDWKIVPVLKHTHRHLFSMKPVLSSEDRFGWRYRDVRSFPGQKTVDPLPSHLDGLPVSQVQAGPIYRTDVLTYADRLGNYDPTLVDRGGNNTTNVLTMRISCLSKEIDPNYLADPMNQHEAWGIRVFVTDPEVRRFLSNGSHSPYHPGTRFGYLHHDGVKRNSVTPDSFGETIRHERYRLLGDVEANDGLVNFYLPANVPVKFNLLHEDGTILAAHRNHHSFAPMQLERRCSGCHQHTDFNGETVPSISFAPTDLVTKTPRLRWDASRDSYYDTTSPDTQGTTATLPEFAEVATIIRTHCGTCHDSQGGTNTHPGTLHFDIDRPTSDGGVPVSSDMALWTWLHREHYVNRRDGAARSPLAWYFYGDRLDREANSTYQPTAATTGSKYWMSTANHPGVNGIDAYKVIEWIDGGAGIDHDPAAVSNPALTDPSRALQGDGYQIAVYPRLASPTSDSLSVGYWDVSANVSEITVSIGGTPLTPVVLSPTSSHGVEQFQLTGTLADSTAIELVVRDTAGNTTRLEKTMRQLRIEAETHRGAAELYTNGRVFETGDLMTFTIAASPAYAGRSIAVFIGDGIYPGYDIGAAYPTTELWALPNNDVWTSVSMSYSGTLNSSGKGQVSIPIPSGLGIIPNLNCVGLIANPDGTYVKTEMVTVRLQ